MRGKRWTRRFPCPRLQRKDLQILPRRSPSSNRMDCDPASRDCVSGLRARSSHLWSGSIEYLPTRLGWFFPKLSRQTDAAVAQERHPSLAEHRPARANRRLSSCGRQYPHYLSRELEFHVTGRVVPYL